MQVQWFELFDTTGGEMRLSFFFRGPDNTVVNQRHFTVNGQSEGWTGDLATSPFVKRSEEVEVPENAVRFYAALKKAGVPAELHIYEKGHHGIRLGRDPKWTGGETSVATWPDRLTNWLKSRGVLGKE